MIKKLFLLSLIIAMTQTMFAQKTVGKLPYDTTKVGGVKPNASRYDAILKVEKGKVISDAVITDSAQYIPVRDTTFTPERIGALTLRPQDLTIYIATSVNPTVNRWKKTATLDTSSLSLRINQKIDSVRKSHDSIFVYRNNGTKVYQYKDSNYIANLPIIVTESTKTISIGRSDVNNDGYLPASAFDSFYNRRFSPYGNTFASGWFLGSNNNFPLLFKINGTERMRLWSGGLSIGNTNTTYPFDVTGTIRGTADAYINDMTIGKGGGSVIDNTVLGFEALLSNTTSNQNVAIGYQASKASGTVGNNAFQNVFIGHNAAYQLVAGSDNVGIGAYTYWYTVGAAGCNYNTAIGKTSLGHVTGSDNTSVGKHAGINITTGSQNTNIGSDVEPTLSTGWRNISIGAGTASLVNTGHDQINIGNKFWARNGKFTIGTSGEAVDSANRLTVYGTTKITDTLKTPNIAAKALDYLNYSPVIVDGSGNQFKTDWQNKTSRVSTQFDKTNTTLANITGLTLTLTAAKTYRFEAVLYTTSDVAGGVKVAIAGTATATNIIYEADVYQGGLTVATGTQRGTALATTVGDITAVTTAKIIIKGTITVNAGGTLTVQFAENAATATSSVLVGSTFTTTEIL